MLRKSLAFLIRSLGSTAGLSLLLVVMSGCTRGPQPSTSPSASLEQTTPDSHSPASFAAPAQERRQLLANLGVEHWHGEGVRGQGMKIAILDSGFRGYAKFLGNGLPDQVHVRSFRKDRNLEARDSQHGIYCGEVLHALAPEAELLLTNWEPDNPQSFLDAVRWAKAAGARIISCSLIMPSWSDGEGGGEVHRGLQQVLGDGQAQGDLLCFASAGNTAERHWCGGFAPDDSGWHRWQDDSIDNILKPWSSERVAVEFYGPLHSSYELLVFQADGGTLIGKTTLSVDSTQTCGRAVVRFEPDPRASYRIRVRCLDGRPSRKRDAFHVVVLGGTLACTTRSGSIPFPGDGACVSAVGAVDQDRQRVSYSSCGPNSRLPKPDFVATVPFPSLCRERPFAGTSAAAPQAAGLAALLWTKHPHWTAGQVLQAMRSAALDLGPPGHDYDTGYGLIRLPK
jgi:hypothetical protein